jgi:hypothetical protein
MVVWTLIQFWLNVMHGCIMFEDWSGYCGYYRISVPW